MARTSGNVLLWLPERDKLIALKPVAFPAEHSNTQEPSGSNLHSLPHPVYPTMHSTSQHRNAFTLIELMTVLLVVGILAILLIPFIAAARSKAETTKCASNLRAIGSGLSLYAMEHSGYIPAGWQTEGRTLYENGAAGLGVLQYEGYIEGKDQTPVRGEIRSSIFNCPTRTTEGWEHRSHWSDYFYNFTGGYYVAGGASLEALPQSRAIVFDFISIRADTAVHDNEKTSNALYPDGSVRNFALGDYRSKDRSTCFNLVSR